MDACLSYALTAKEREGVWGGLLMDERIDLRDELAGLAPRREPPDHGEEARYARGCRCQHCRTAHARPIADWRARRRCAATRRAA